MGDDQVVFVIGCCLYVVANHSGASAARGQGLINDRVMISVNNFAQSVLRGHKSGAVGGGIYTDAIAGLPGAIANRYDKTTALALQKERDVQRLQKAHAPKRWWMDQKPSAPWSARNARGPTAQAAAWSARNRRDGVNRTF